MSKLIGTAGHVDHGKTSLIRALSGIDADRLPEEKARGMTIDLGFAYLDLPGFGRASIVDVPGHERFLTNMLAGALGVDVALLCVAADASVMPQTREHLAILDLLPVERLVVALTRADLADEILLEISREEVAHLLAGTRFAGAAIVPVSALRGDGIESLREALAEALKEASTAKPGPWYLPIDRVFTVKGHGTIVTGTLMQGEVAQGEAAVIQPTGEPTRVRGIQGHEESHDLREYGTRTALNLQGVDLQSVHRGMAVGAPGALFATQRLDAQLRWVAGAKHGESVRVAVGADDAIAKVFLNDHDPSLIQLRFERPVAVALGQPIIVRRASPPVLLGGGRVLVPQAHPRRRGAPPGTVQGETDLERVQALVAAHPDGIPTEELCRRLGRTAQQLGDPLEALKQRGALLGFAGMWLTPDGFARASDRLRASLWALHDAQPTQAGHPREAVVKAADLPWSGKWLDRVLSALVEADLVRVQGNLLIHPEFRVRLNARQEELLGRLEQVLEGEGFLVPPPREYAAQLGVPKQALEQIAEIGVQAGRLVRIAPELYYTAAQVASMAEVARGMGKPFTASEFREALGVSRKYAIPILEWLDAHRITLRQGETRVVRPGP